ncbi:hypothetical protein NU09_2144 [Flavobacterium beibuense]|uniref:Uncharacterized protein n=1 Tax=Flavobacterium beibuense TaxID=657326 RepID=A0A444W9R4_9FLAO|nr:hypothetical protein NU09_2144 [Flavobacterium beibuense]
MVIQFKISKYFPVIFLINTTSQLKYCEGFEHHNIIISAPNTKVAKSGF